MQWDLLRSAQYSDKPLQFRIQRKRGVDHLLECVAGTQPFLRLYRLAHIGRVLHSEGGEVNANIVTEIAGEGFIPIQSNFKT